MNMLHVSLARAQAKIACIRVATVALCLVAVPARANLIANGDFETGTLANWTSTGNVATASLPFFGFNNPADGSTIAVFNGGNATPNGTLSQSFSTVIGATYLVGFGYGVNGGQTQSITSAATDSLGATVGSLLASSSNTSLDAFSFGFIADTAVTSLKFTDFASNPTYNTDGALDNVTVTRVPEPTSAGLLVGGLLMTFVLRRYWASRA